MKIINSYKSYGIKNNLYSSFLLFSIDGIFFPL